ncbi:Pre-rRNA-processing protein TSR2 -like protein [Sarcoptes scabiei]|nr:Pre-rRNA-processing protein TSR2 -like protein [Sarcoptes scabiei]UXI16994.1 Bis 5'-nucleosyl-tetraphosphatase [Sarcoptes scabiei]
MPKVSSKRVFTNVSRQFFLRSIRETFQCWPAFQVAIQNGMGGNDAKQKIEWFCENIVELFAMNPTLDLNDLTDYVSEVLDEEFNTIIGDGSLDMVCANIYTFEKHIVQNDYEFVIGKLELIKQNYDETLPSSTVVTESGEDVTQSRIVCPSSTVTDFNDEMSDSTNINQQNDNDDQNPMEISNDVDGEPSETNAENNDSEWTVVRRKK